jgi:hypothetical protein
MEQARRVGRCDSLLQIVEQEPVWVCVCVCERERERERQPPEGRSARACRGRRILALTRSLRPDTLEA